MGVVVYTTPTCGFCRQVKAYLNRNCSPLHRRDAEYAEFACNFRGERLPLGQNRCHSLHQSWFYPKVLFLCALRASAVNSYPPAKWRTVGFNRLRPHFPPPFP